MTLPSFDELHVISDLHLGGETKDFQVFKGGAELAKLIDQLARDSTEGRLGLCLNGDTVDFLAMPDARYLDTERAVQKLESIFENGSFKEVWNALARFVRKPERELILVLGNHDVELALPEVRECLLGRLAGDDAAARGRIRFAIDGTGFACTVGSARVLCLHGNEVDSWNVVDFSALREVVNALNRGRAVPDWEANAGTRLVVDLMNSVKERFAWVDLLKPNTRPVFGLLAVLGPEYYRRAHKLSPILVKLAFDHARRLAGFLGETEAGRALPAKLGAGEAMEKLIGIPRRKPSSLTAGQDALVQVVEQFPDENHDPLDIMAATDSDEYLGLAGGLWNRFRGRDPEGETREALRKWLGDDKSFELDHEDATFKNIVELVGPEVDFVIAGHTHLRRALGFDTGMYYNTGTWMRLIRLEQKQLSSKTRFKDVWKALEDGSLEVLDESGCVKSLPTVASVIKTENGVEGHLSDFAKTGRRWQRKVRNETRHVVR